MQRVTRRQFGRLSAAAGAVALGGCAPWEYDDPQHGIAKLSAKCPPPSPLEWRVLNRIGYGARPGDLERLRAIGTDAWVERQLHPEAIDEPADLLAALDRLDTLSLTPEEARDREIEWEADNTIAPLMRKVIKVGKDRGLKAGPVMQQLAQATVLRAAFSERTLEQIMVELWSDHFSIYQLRGPCRWLKAADDSAIRRYALGRFRELLGASAHSAAMMAYLDNAENRKIDAATGGRLNENYARELLELHTLEETSTYSLTDIQEVARVLTGWTIGRSGSEWGQFVFRADQHDDGPKQVLDVALPAGGGQQEGERLLDYLARHELTARAITGKLCDRFVGCRPQALHERLTVEFQRTDGAIRSVLRALFASDDFRAGEQSVFRRPFAFAIAALRSLGARTSGQAVVNYLEQMGQRPFYHIQPDGYPMRPESWTPAIGSRWQFALDLVTNRIGETWVNTAALRAATNGWNATDLARRLAASVLPGQLDEAEIAKLADVASQNVEPIEQCLALLIMSPAFQWC